LDFGIAPPRKEACWRLSTKPWELHWSYSVNKGRGQKNMQSLAEAVAVHLKDDYLKKQK
jgi:hypothetical protein